MFRLVTRQGSIPKRFFSTRGFDAVLVGASVRNNQPKLRTLDISTETQHIVENQLGISGFKKAGDVRVLYNVNGVNQVAVVCVDDKNGAKETARRAVS
ncbi:hypothetical protein G6F56_005299 [Rhizopus delemar]|nr:hypothetical protein G6F56_005299 [Rhizopus delemar]